MFLPNTYCQRFARSDVQDIWSNYTYAPADTLPCSIVSLDLRIDRSSVRVDSSASRGRSEEETGTARILYPVGTSIKEGDIIQVDDVYIEVVRIYPRRDVLGNIDHIQVDFRKGAIPNVQ